MDAPRRFDMPDDDVDPDPLQFTLGGKTLPVPEKPSEPWEETFTVLQHVPPAALVTLSIAATVTPDGDIAWNSVSVVRFLRNVLVPSDEARWDALMLDKLRRVDVNALADVMFYITGEKAGRPTGPQPGSPAGSAATNGGSVNGSDDKVKRSKGSAHKRS